MTLNGDKTNLVLFRRQEYADQKKTPYLDTFQAVECAKYLGILVENLLSWGSHMRHLNLKSTRGIGILTKLPSLVKLQRHFKITVFYVCSVSYWLWAYIMWYCYELNHKKKKNAGNLKKDVRKIFLKVTMLTENHCLKNSIYWAFINKRHLILFSSCETV